MRSSTPFFKTFGPLLFGRRPGHKIKEGKAIESLGELYEIFGDLVPEKELGLEPKGSQQPGSGAAAAGDVLGVRVAGATRDGAFLSFPHPPSLASLVLGLADVSAPQKTSGTRPNLSLWYL